MNDIQAITWFAGLFEGEGTFTFYKGKPKRIAVTMTDIDVIERIQKYFGGHVYKIGTRKKHWKDAWVWVSFGQESIDTTNAILPYLGERRSEKAREYVLNYITKEKLSVIRAEKAAALMEKVLILRSQGLTHKAIAESLGFNRTYITKLLNSHGV